MAVLSRVLVANGLDVATVRAAQPVPHTPHVRTDPTPLVCGRAVGFAAYEAIARDQNVGPEHLLGLLREANEPIGTDLPAQSRRERVLLSPA